MHARALFSIPTRLGHECAWPRRLIFGAAIAWAATAFAQTAGHQHGQHGNQAQPGAVTPPAAAGHAGHGVHAAPGGQPATAGHGAMAFGGIPDTQDASGTAWQPSATPMHAHHAMWGDWQGMAHYNVFLGYDNQSGRRGDEQLNSINWLMLMATRRTETDDLMFRGMFSLEPWTTTAKGYPLLFQSGEAYHGRAIVDRQHPHDFFMELAARYRRLVAADTVLSLYAAPSGEPALGPPAFPHRLSAMDNPAAPISHHWLDSSHITFGVLTVGVARKTWQLEGSWFNGREPDEDRWDIEHPKLDSYSGRFSWNPKPEWSAQVSHGFLESPEELHPHEHLRRTTASLMHLATLPGEGHLATTAGWGSNDHGGHTTDAFLLEANYLTPRRSFFARAERVEKLGEELNVPPAHGRIAVKQLTVGMTHELLRQRPGQLALGGSVTWSFVSDDLERVYGRRPVGFWIFLRLRPAAMQH